MTASYFIGGSDARVIMGGDETALIRLWQEKRGEAEPADLSGELVVQAGPRDRGAQTAPGTSASPAIGLAIGRPENSILRLSGWRPHWTAWLSRSGRCSRAKFMLPWSFAEQAAAEKTHGPAAAQHDGGRNQECRALHHLPAAANGWRWRLRPSEASARNASNSCSWLPLSATYGVGNGL